MCVCVPVCGSLSEKNVKQRTFTAITVNFAPNERTQIYYFTVLVYNTHNNEWNF